MGEEKIIIVNNNNNNNNIGNDISTKSWLVTFLLAIFLGIFGVHRFYTKKVGTGILYLCTLGLGGIGVIWDIITLILHTYKDGYGRVLR